MGQEDEGTHGEAPGKVPASGARFRGGGDPRDGGLGAVREAVHGAAARGKSEKVPEIPQKAAGITQPRQEEAGVSGEAADGEGQGGAAAGAEAAEEEVSGVTGDLCCMLVLVLRLRVVLIVIGAVMCLILLHL